MDRLLLAAILLLAAAAAAALPLPAAAAAAAPAQAAEVWVGPPNPYDYFSGSVVNVRAWAGEENHLSYAVSPDGASVTIVDTGARPVAAAGCVQAAANAVTCTSSASTFLRAGDVELGDLNDTAVVALLTSARWESFGVEGGGGNDPPGLGRSGLVDEPHAGPHGAV